jgi:gliding motility-associated-like protein
MKHIYQQYFLRVRAHCALTLICVSALCYAQQDNVWVLNQGSGMYTLDFNYQPPKLSRFDTMFNLDTKFRISSNFNGPDGRLKYFTATDGKLYDSALKLKYDFDQASASPTTCTTPITFNGIDYMITLRTRFQQNEAFVEGDIHSLDNVPTARVLSDPLFTHDFKDLYSSGFKYYVTVPFDERYIYIIGQYTNSMKSILYDPVRNSVLKDTVFVKDIYMPGTGTVKPIAISPDFTKLAIIRDTKLPNDTFVHQASLSIFDFDKETGVFGEERVLLQSGRIESENSFWPKIFMHCVTFSADNKFVFLSTINDHKNSSKYIYRINLESGATERYHLSDNISLYWLKLGPDGKVYVLPMHSDASKPSLRNIGVINSPSSDNWQSSVSFSEKHLDQFVGTTLKRLGLSSVPQTNGYYVKVNFEATNSCAGLYTAFENTSDSTHFSRYRFYFGDGDSAEIDDLNNILIAGKDNLPNPDNWGVLHRYDNPGTYLAKIRAFNEAGGWVWYSDSVVVIEPSVPKFSVADTTGCQWIAYQIQDLSKVVNKGKDVTYHWTFGDGTDSTELNPRTNTRQYKTYSQSGNYKIQLTIDDGYCTDSFSLENKVEILDAPQPGMLATPLEGCEPVVVDVSYRYGDATDSIAYTWGDGVRSSGATGTEQHTYQIYPTYLTTQEYPLIQYLYGPTGCVTTDTAAIIVHPGFYSTDLPYMRLVTVAESQEIAIKWDSFPGATEYVLYRNGVIVDTTAEFSYLDNTFEIAQKRNEYTIRATNVCLEETEASNLGTNILLVGKGSDDNTISIVEWTPYQDWEKGVNAYSLEVQNEDKSFTEIYREGSGADKTYQDNTFLASALAGFSTYKCYRIAAYENEYPQQVSYSNVECVPYKPVIFIPTAFSPNADGLNDVYRPITFGIEHYEVKIYNRYGQKITQFDQTSKGWDASDAAMGAYMVTIRAKGTDNEWYNEKSTVTVVR